MRYECSAEKKIERQGTRNAKEQARRRIPVFVPRLDEDGLVYGSKETKEGLTTDAIDAIHHWCCKIQKGLHSFAIVNTVEAVLGLHCVLGPKPNDRFTFFLPVCLDNNQSSENRSLTPAEWTLLQSKLTTLLPRTHHLSIGLDLQRSPDFRALKLQFIPIEIGLSVPSRIFWIPLQINPQ